MCAYRGNEQFAFLNLFSAFDFGAMREQSGTVN
jgi:hypothetical protein